MTQRRKEVHKELPAAHPVACWPLRRCAITWGGWSGCGGVSVTLFGKENVVKRGDEEQSQRDGVKRVRCHTQPTSPAIRFLVFFFFLFLNIRYCNVEQTGRISPPAAKF
jgi:hypothetical protein